MTTTRDAAGTAPAPGRELDRRSASGFEVFGQSLAATGPSIAIAGTVAVVYLTAGKGTIWSYVLATVVVVLVGYSIAQFARRTAAAGSLYTYTASGLGRGTAFAGGWGLIFGYAGIAAACLAGAALYFGAFLVKLGVGAESRAWQLPLLVVFLVLTVAMPIRGVRISTRVAVTLEIISLLAIGVLLIGLFVHYGARADTSQFKATGSNATGIALGTVLAVGAFVGFESSASLGIEARSPHRAIPAGDPVHRAGRRSALHRLRLRPGTRIRLGRVAGQQQHPAERPGHQRGRRLAQVGVETEFFLLDPQGEPLAGAIHCYSLEKLNEFGPVLAQIADGLAGYVPVEAVTSEYGPGQLEINVRHSDPLTAADDAFRLKYAVRALARAAGARATFMAKPFQGLSGSSMHLHVSLWQGDTPAFGPRAGTENPLMRMAIAGIVRHLPAITIFGAPSINSYKRLEPRSYAPTTATWGGDNRTAAVRTLVEAEHSTRIELRTPGADANPYWAISSLLAAVIAGLEDGEEAAGRGRGDLYGTGQRLPRTPAEAAELARSDKRIIDLLGEDAVHDYTLLVEQDWTAYLTTVTSWERDRYLELA